MTEIQRLVVQKRADKFRVKAIRKAVNLWRRGMDFSTPDELRAEINRLGNLRVHYYKSGRRARDCKKLLKRQLLLCQVEFFMFMF